MTLAYQSEGNTDKGGLKDMGATRQLETEGEVSGYLNWALFCDLQCLPLLSVEQPAERVLSQRNVSVTDCA